MQTIDINAARTQGDIPAEPLKFSKRIGSTVYLVSVHSSKTSPETVQEKIQRLIEREVRDSA
jgi:hypothetical protein